MAGRCVFCNELSYTLDLHEVVMIIHDCFCENASAFWWTDACILLIPELLSLLGCKV